jgi:hypothetical protein
MKGDGQECPPTLASALSRTSRFLTGLGARFGMTSLSEGGIPQGLKPGSFLRRFAARLNTVPFPVVVNPPVLVDVRGNVTGAESPVVFFELSRGAEGAALPRQWTRSGRGATLEPLATDLHGFTRM